MQRAISVQLVAVEVMHRPRETAAPCSQAVTVCQPAMACHSEDLTNQHPFTHYKTFPEYHKLGRDLAHREGRGRRKRAVRPAGTTRTAAYPQRTPAPPHARRTAAAAAAPAAACAASCPCSRAGTCHSWWGDQIRLPQDYTDLERKAAHIRAMHPFQATLLQHVQQHTMCPLKHLGHWRAHRSPPFRRTGSYRYMAAKVPGQRASAMAAARPPPECPNARQPALTEHALLLPGVSWAHVFRFYGRAEQQRPVAPFQPFSSCTALRVRPELLAATTPAAPAQNTRARLIACWHAHCSLAQQPG